jgi:hypothetical protein
MVISGGGSAASTPAAAISPKSTALRLINSFLPGGRERARFVMRSMESDRIRMFRPAVRGGSGRDHGE